MGRTWTDLAGEDTTETTAPAGTDTPKTQILWNLDLIYGPLLPPTDTCGVVSWHAPQTKRFDHPGNPPSFINRAVGRARSQPGGPVTR